MTNRRFILVFLLLAAWLCASHLPSQEVVPPSVPAAATGAMPTSIRVTAPASYFTDANPDTEGQLGLPTDDPNHLYVWHLNHWRASALPTSQP